MENIKGLTVQHAAPYLGTAAVERNYLLPPWNDSESQFRNNVTRDWQKDCDMLGVTAESLHAICSHIEEVRVDRVGFGNLEKGGSLLAFFASVETWEREIAPKQMDWLVRVVNEYLSEYDYVTILTRAYDPRPGGLVPMVVLPANKAPQNQYIIRTHGEPAETNSEGFKYVKTYDDQSVTWTYTAQRAKRVLYTEAFDVQLNLREVETDSEIVPAPVDTVSSTPESDKPVEAMSVRTVTDADWKIKRGKTGNFIVSRTSDGLFLKGVVVCPDSVGYIWTENEENARKFGSLAAANGYASDVLLWQTYRGSDHPQLPVKAGPKVGRNKPCPCGSGKKWKKCCLGAK